jgi:maleylacetate reductase
MNPPVIHWGAGSVAVLAQELERLKVSRPVIATTRSLLDSVDRLPMKPVATTVIGQHAPMQQIEAGVEAARGARADGVVSFGGGSAIDAGKVISLRAASGENALPHIAIPTTLSVAELASGAGYTNEAGDKAGLRDPRMLAAAVIYDPELTLLTPLELWLSTGIRALDHAVEGFLAEGEHPFNDVLALDAIRRLFYSLPLTKASPEDVAARTENQLAAWFSFTLPAQSAGGLSHTMGKQIGARHGIPHGVTSCLLLPHVMRYLEPRMPERFAALALVTGAGPADRVEELIQSLELPQHISQFGIGQDALRRAAEELAGTYPAADLLGIYLAAL